MRSFHSNHVSVVTGASTGIGAAAAMALACRGSHVVVHYNQNRSSAESVVASICDNGGRAVLVQADLSEPGTADSVAEAAQEAFGHVDLLVNNAGSMVGRRVLLEITDDFWEQVIATNVTSVLRMTRALAPQMIARRSGVVINVASVAARNGGGPGVMPYASAKSAVLSMTKGLAKELICFGIRVNAVNPGVVATPFHERFSSAEQMKNMIANIPQGRVGTAPEIASVIAFLASDDASHIVGETIEINGGLWME